MNLSKIKQLEDLKSENKPLAEQVATFQNNLKKGLSDKAKEDFKKFFSEKGFQIANQEFLFAATYRDLKIVLALSAPHESFLGAMAIYTLTISQPQKEYSIYPRQKNIGEKKAPLLSVIAAKTEEEKLEKNIKDLQNQITTLKTFIAEFDKVEIIYTFKENVKNGNKLITGKVVEYNSILEILNFLFD